MPALGSPRRAELEPARRSRRPGGSRSPVVLALRRRGARRPDRARPGPGARRPPGEGARAGSSSSTAAVRVEAGGETSTRRRDALPLRAGRAALGLDRGGRADPAPARAVARRGPLPRQRRLALLRLVGAVEPALGRTPDHGVHEVAERQEEREQEDRRGRAAARTAGRRSSRTTVMNISGAKISARA